MPPSTPAAYPAFTSEPFAPFCLFQDAINGFAPVAIALSEAAIHEAVIHKTAIQLATAHYLPLTLGQTDQIEQLLQFDFSTLPSFTRVQQQYRTWGIELEAIAIQPSNPVFLDPSDLQHSGGLMPAVEQQPLTVQFHQTRRLVNLTLLTVKQLVVRAYDAANRLIAEQQVGHHSSPRHLEGRADQAACHQIQFQAEGLARVEILSSAPFLLRNLSCG